MRFDVRMRDTVAETGAAAILMHMRGRPRDMQEGDLSYRDVVTDIAEFLRDRMEEAKSAGIGTDRIVIDPGIGFGKTAADNAFILKNLMAFKALGRPILTGVSRKSFIGRITGMTR